MEPRPDSQTRCAYCHAAAGEHARTCEGCGTIVHPECLGANGGCPTLGCGPRAAASLAPRPLRSDLRPARQSLPSFATAGALALALIALAFVHVGAFVLVGAGGAAWLVATLADSSIARARRRADPAPLTPAEVDEALGSVDGWLGLEDPDRVGELALEVLARAPRDPVPRLRLALSHAGRGEVGEAEAALTTALGASGRLPRGAGAYVAALSHAVREEWSRALVALDLAESRSVSLPRAALAALSRAAKGDWSRARHALARRADGACSVWTLRARLLRCSGDLNGALAAAEEAVRCAGFDDPAPFEVRARVRLLCGLPGVALEDLGLAAARAWRGEAGTHLARGVTRAITGDLAGARRDLLVAVERAPAWALPRVWLVALGDPPDAKGLGAFELALARAVSGASPAAPLLEHHTVGRRRLRLAHGLLGVAAEVRGDGELARSHASAVRELGDDGTLVCDWALVRATGPASRNGA